MVILSIDATVSVAGKTVGSYDFPDDLLKKLSEFGKESEVNASKLVGVIEKKNLPDGYPYSDMHEIKWDGKTNGLENVGKYYLVSSLTPTHEEMKNGSYIYGLMDETNYLIKNCTYNEGTQAYDIDRYIAVAFADGGTLSDGTILPKSGLYFCMSDPISRVISLTYGNIELIAKSLLPKVSDDWVDSIRTDKLTGNISDNKLSESVVILKNTPDTTPNKYNGMLLYVSEINSTGTRVKFGLMNGLILPSSTSGSNKLFKLTVDDSGTISATEVSSFT